MSMTTLISGRSWRSARATSTPFMPCNDVLVVAVASDAGEWEGQVLYLPLYIAPPTLLADAYWTR